MPRDPASKSCWMHGAAPDQESMEENHIDLIMSHVILNSLEALPGLVLLGKKAQMRTVARPGGESDKISSGSHGLQETKPGPCGRRQRGQQGMWHLALLSCAPISSL